MYICICMYNTGMHECLSVIIISLNAKPIFVLSFPFAVS